MMVQNRFHKDDDGELHDQILCIEAYIGELSGVVESCRKIILVSKFAAGTGGILIFAIIIGAIGFNATVMIGSSRRSRRVSRSGVPRDLTIGRTARRTCRRLKRGLQLL
jgi:hypothetical protein